MMSSTEQVARNGTVPGPSSDPLGDVIGQLEEKLAPLAAERTQLEAQVAELLRQEERIKAGISALRGSAPRSPRPAVKGGRDSHDWWPSEKTRDEIYAAIAAADAPLTVAQITERVAVSSSTVKKALDLLRSEQKIRLAGTAPSQGAPKIYGVMP
jgi:seryl-tRNA synthetase